MADITAMPDKYLICRDRSLGHDWDVQDGFKLTRRQEERHGHDITRFARCPRCTTTRLEYFDHTAADGYIERVGHPQYKYPEDYKWPPGVRNKEVHSEMWRRQKASERKAKRTAKAVKS